VKKYRITVMLETFIEAESEEQAFDSAPKVPQGNGWEIARVDPFDVEEL